MTLTLEVMTAKGRACRSGSYEPGAAERLRPLDETDPLLRAIAAAPEDDEPFTADDEIAIEQVEADRARRVQAIPFEEVMRKYQRA
jgi:hypothetical protein